MKYILYVIIIFCFLQSCNQNKQRNTLTQKENSTEQLIDYCNYQIIKRDDGVIVTQFPVIPIASDSNLEFGISLSSNGFEYFLSTLIRFHNTSSKINGDLTIRLDNNNMLTFKLVNSSLSHIGNSETSIGIFSINKNQLNDLSNSDLLTISFLIKDSVIYTMECKQNKSVLKEQIKCTNKLKNSEFELFNSNNYHYEIYLPKYFKNVTTSSKNIDLKAQSKDGSSIIISIYPRTKEEYSITAHDYTKEALVQLFQQQNLTHNIVKSEKIFIDNCEAFLIYYTSQSTNTKAIEIYFYKGDFAYVMTATTTQDIFDDNESILLKSLNSFKFKSSNQEN